MGQATGPTIWAINNQTRVNQTMTEYFLIAKISLSQQYKPVFNTAEMLRSNRTRDLCGTREHKRQKNLPSENRFVCGITYLSLINGTALCPVPLYTV